MRDVVIAPTVDRSVLGIMVDFAKAIPVYLESGQRTDDVLLRAKWQDASVCSSERTRAVRRVE